MVGNPAWMGCFSTTSRANPAEPELRVAVDRSETPSCRRLFDSLAGADERSPMNAVRKAIVGHLQSVTTDWFRVG
jgi:hypothetical protein